MLVRPSLPWCFPIREISCEIFEQEQQEQEQQQQQEEKVAKAIFFDCFQKLH